MSTTIFLVDDHQIVRQGLRLLLERQPEFRVIGEAGDGASALAAIPTLKPDVVILDIALPDASGIEVARRLLTQRHDLKIMVLSIHDEKAMVLDALSAGVRAYLLKESAYEEMLSAIRLVLADQIYLSQKLTDLVVRDYLNHLPTISAEKSTLTDREREVWQYVAEGLSNREVADRLCLSVRTVEFHRKRVMEKLEARSVADLVRLALRDGIIK